MLSIGCVGKRSFAALYVKEAPIGKPWAFNPGRSWSTVWPAWATCGVGVGVGGGVGVAVGDGDDNELLCEPPPQAVRSRVEMMAKASSRILIFFITTSFFNGYTTVSIHPHRESMHRSHRPNGYSVHWHILRHSLVSQTRRSKRN